MSQNYASRFHAAAQRVWPTARIEGDGPFAVATGCDFVPLVYLHGQEADASAKYTLLQERGCGITCARVHQFIRLQ